MGDAAASREEQADANSHEYCERRCQDWAAKPLQPAGLRLGHFFAQSRLQPRVEIWRRLRCLPFIEHRHGSAQGLKFFHASATTFQMLTLVRGEFSESCRDFGHPFTNFVAVHNRFPFSSLRLSLRSNAV